MVIVFAVVSVVGTAGMVGLEFAFGDVGDSPLAGVAYGASFGLLAAAIACMVVAWPLLQDCRRVLGRDYATQKAILRVVVRNKNDELTEDGRRRAATYAAIMARYLPFQHGQLVLLMSSVWLQQLWNLTDRLSSGIRPLTVALVIGYPALLAVLLPISIRRTFRVKRYAADNADLVTSRFVDLEPPTSG